MQRRQLLKLFFPLTLVATGLVISVSVFKKSACEALGFADLLKRLKPFSDAELGKKMSVEITNADLTHFDGLCEDSFDNNYRELVAKEFRDGKTKNVDGWILSEAEFATHLLTSRAVHLSNAQISAGSVP